MLEGSPIFVVNVGGFSTKGGSAYGGNSSQSLRGSLKEGNMLTVAELLRIGGIILGIIGIMISLSLIFFPKQLLRLNNVLNRQISTDKLRLILEKDFDITSIIMQARVVAGVITLLLSFILLVIAMRI